MKTLKTRAFEWISSLYELYSFGEIEKAAIDRSFNFKLEGFADEPLINSRTTIVGLKLGFEAIFWFGHVPSPGLVKKHSVTWDTLQSLDKEQQQEMILELLLKTINSRKRQYRKCQFCGEKIANGHRIDKDTCHSCASEHLGVVF